MVFHILLTSMRATPFVWLWVECDKILLFSALHISSHWPAKGHLIPRKFPFHQWDMALWLSSIISYLFSLVHMLNCYFAILFFHFLFYGTVQKHVQQLCGKLPKKLPGFVSKFAIWFVQESRLRILINPTVLCRLLGSLGSLHTSCAS